jgi:hypothetical protein
MGAVIIWAVLGFYNWNIYRYRDSDDILGGKIMSQTYTSHSIKHRAIADNEFMTPPEVARMLIAKVPLVAGDSVLDSAVGTGSFFLNYPSDVKGLYSTDFYNWTEIVDWIVTNPPYSGLEEWLKHSFEVADKGVAYLLGLHNITPRRLEIGDKAGFGVTSIHLHKVCPWYGIQAFVIWQKGKSSILSYDRIVWGSNKKLAEEKDNG